jgi:hypothetical protein
MGSPVAGEYKPGEKVPETVDRWRQALELRRSGESYQEIADRLGYANPSGAYDAVMGALKATLAEPAADVRRMEADRLDRLTLAAWPLATSGDLKAMDRVLSIMDRRARLLGLDAPTRAVVETAVKGYAVGNGPDDLSRARPARARAGRTSKSSTPACSAGPAPAPWSSARPARA